MISAVAFRIKRGEGNLPSACDWLDRFQPSSVSKEHWLTNRWEVGGLRYARMVQESISLKTRDIVRLVSKAPMPTSPSRSRGPNLELIDSS